MPGKFPFRSTDFSRTPTWEPSKPQAKASNKESARASDTKTAWESLTPPEQNRQNWQTFLRGLGLAVDFTNRTILHPERLWRQIITWPVVGTVVLALVGIAFGFAMSDSPELLLAKLCFISSATIFLAKVVHWIVTERASRIERMVLTFILFGLTGIGLVEVLAWLKTRQPSRQIPTSRAVASNANKNEPAADDSPTQSTSGAPLPIVFDAAVTWDKQLLFGNFGEFPIYDVEVRITEYTLNYKAFAEERLEIEFYTKHGGKPDFYALGKLEPKHRSGPFDLKQKVKFVNFPKNEDKINRPDTGEWIRKVYALRITFRDDRNGLKYVAYKITGSIIGFGIFENKETEGETGGVNRTFIQQIPSFITAHQKQLYGLADNEREYVLSP